ncbi:hypothetical protein D3C78_1644490 [compost metagenome]
MVEVLVARLALQAVNDFFDILHMVFMGNQYSVLGFNNHQVLDANSGNQAAIGMYIGIPGAVG